MSSEQASVAQPKGSLCPHFRNVDEDLIDDLFSEVAKVRADRPDMFRFTHRQISVFDQKNDDASMTEDQVLKRFTRDRNRNEVAVIEGNVGTGKSELCAYLALELKEEGRKVLHIDKNADLLTIMAEEIPDFYHRVTGKTLEGRSDLERLQSHVSTDRGTVASLIVSKTILAVSELDNTSVDFSSEARDELESFVATRLNQIIQRGDFATTVSFVEAPEVQTRDFLDVFEDVDAETAADNWNEAIWSAIREEYDTPTMDVLLERVARDLDERPVLVFEDFSISSLDANRLQEYLEEDNPENAWDFIIAGTQDSTRVLHTQTAEDRDWIRFYRTNIRDSSQVTFLDKTTAVDFIRPFLGYIKHYDDNSVAYDFNEKKEIIDITDPADESLCDLCGFCDDDFRDIFPFNREFLKRIYTGLPPEEQRPRIYVQTVYRVLQDYYDNTEAVPAASDELDELGKDIVLGEEVYQNSDLRMLAQFYGEFEGRENGEEVVLVDRRFPRAFGIDDESEYETLGIEVTRDDDGTEYLEFVVTEGESTDDDDDTIDGTEEIDPIEERHEDVRKHIDTWQANPENPTASDVNVYMNRGLTHALEQLTNGFQIQQGGEIEYLVGGERQPFTFLGGEPPEDDQIEIDPEDFTHNDLLTILRYGIAREMNPQRADFDNLIDDMGTQLCGYADRWQSMMESTYFDAQYVYGAAASHRSFDEFIASAYGLLAILEDPTQTVTASYLAEVFASDETPTIDESLQQTLLDFMDRDPYEELGDLIEKADRIEDLFGDRFAISENVVDVPRLEETIGDSSVFEVIDDTTKSAINSLPARVRFDSKTNLRDVALIVKNARSSCEYLPAKEPALAAPEYLNQQLRGVDMEEVRSVVDKLKTYDTVDPELLEYLTRLSRIDKDEIDQLLDACITFETLRSSPDGDAIHTHLLGLKIFGHEAVELITTIDFESEGETTGASKFEEVSQIYVNQ